MAENNGKEIYAPSANVLIVDDVESNLFVVKKLMKPYGMTVDTVTSGPQAIDKIKGGAVYDIIFMDHMMPEMDGVEATKIIRETGINTPIIALTANEAEGAGEMFLAAGMNGLLTKPVNKEALEKILAAQIPAGKFADPEGKTAGANEAAPEIDAGLRRGIEQIRGISVQTGLERVSGHWDVYEKLLRLTVKEHDKFENNLNNFLAAGDLRGFAIEVHGLKSVLANIGVMELSARARTLEDESNNGNAGFCASELPSFLEGYNAFISALAQAFEKDKQKHGLPELPPELPSIFDKLKKAFDTNDFEAIDEGMENLNALNPAGALKEEIDKINEAVLTLDYNSALEVMKKLLT